MKDKQYTNAANAIDLAESNAESRLDSSVDSATKIDEKSKKDSRINLGANNTDSNPKTTLLKGIPINTAILFVSICAFCLTLLKFAIGVVSGSVVVLASALDSLFDTLFSISNYFALKKSQSPSNQNFNYGFGKIEGFASMIEGGFIFASGLFIIYKSIIKFAQDGTTEHISESIVVMLVSILVTLGLVAYLKTFLKHTKNLILEAEILHYKSDLLSNLAVIISLVIIWLTGFEVLDSIIGGILGIYICYSAFKILKNGFLMLLDRAIDDELHEKITQVLDANTQITSYHDLKSRISGNTIFLECHLVFSEDILLLDAHNISDKIEREIERLCDKHKWVILIHLDPYDDSCKENIC